MENIRGQDPKVGDIWYRYEDKWYSVADEWGNHSYSTLRVELWLSTVVKVTPKGVWIVPGKVTVVEGEYKGLRSTSDESFKFICHGWTKKYACATREEALKSLKARRRRQRSIYEARARAAGEVLLHIKMNRKMLLNKEGY